VSAEPGLPTRDHAQRSAVVPCSCGRWEELEIGAELPTEARCHKCAQPIATDFAAHVGADGTLDGCPACGYHTLAIQKDVNARLGVIVVFAVFTALLLLRVPLPWMFAVLVPFALLDWLILRTLVKRFLLCYRCKAQFRGFPPGPRCRPFDLATWEAHT
jgi:hypothetical protein